MATKRKTPIPAVTGVSPGNTVTAKIPVGPRYHKLFVKAQGAGKTLPQLIKEMRFMVNGKQQHQYTIAELDDLNKRNGARFAYVENGAGKESMICIHFNEVWRKDYDVADGQALRTLGLSGLELQIDIADDAPATTKISISAATDKSILAGPDGKQAPNQLLALRKIVRRTFNLTGSLEEGFALNRTDLYQVISFYDPHIQRVTMTLDGFLFFDQTKAEADRDLLDNELVPVDGRFDIVFDADDVPDSALPFAKDSDLRVQIYLDEESEDDETSAFPRPMKIMIEEFGAPI